MKIKLALLGAILIAAPSAVWADAPETDDVATEGADELAQTDGETTAEDAAEEIEADTDIVEEVEDAEESGGLDLPINISASLSTRTGICTIARPGYTCTEAISLSPGLSLSYPFEIGSESFAISWSWSYNKYVTPEGGSQEQYEGRWGDMGINLSYGNFYTIPVLEIGLSTYLSASIPTSASSQFQNLYTSIGTGLSMSRRFGNFSLGYSFGYRKNLHRDPGIVIDPADYPNRPFRPDELRSDEALLTDGVLPSYSISNSLSAGYTWLDDFRTSLSWTFSTSVRYAVDQNTETDEFSNDEARPVRRSQVMIGGISQSYSFLDNYSASLSFSTAQQPLTADNRRVRFPFWDTQTGNLQGTSVALSLSGSW